MVSGSLALRSGPQGGGGGYCSRYIRLSCQIHSMFPLTRLLITCIISTPIKHLIKAHTTSHFSCGLLTCYHHLGGLARKSPAIFNVDSCELFLSLCVCMCVYWGFTCILTGPSQCCVHHVPSFNFLVSRITQVLLTCFTPFTICTHRQKPKTVF